MNPETLKLYHGTDALKGDIITIRSNKGIGHNETTLGHGFYTSTSLEIATCYSHMMLRKNASDWNEKSERHGVGNVYSISLSPGIRILRETDQLDIGGVVSVLKDVGVKLSDIHLFSLSDLQDFSTIVDVLHQTGSYGDNASEFLTERLGFDALMAIQKPFLPYQYEPQHLGFDWSLVFESWEISPPETIVIYNAEKILSAELIISGTHFCQTLDTHSQKNIGNDLNL